MTSQVESSTDAQAVASAEALLAIRSAATGVFEEAMRKGYKPFVMCAAIETASKLTLAIQALDRSVSQEELKRVLMNAAARATERSSQTRSARARQRLIDRELQVVVNGVPGLGGPSVLQQPPNANRGSQVAPPQEGRSTT